MREHEADCRPIFTDQFRNDRCEIEAIRAQPVQPDDAYRRLVAGFNFVGFKNSVQAILIRGE